MKNYPTEQHETTWSTSDNKAYFYVSGENKPILGYIQSDLKTVNVRYAMRPQVTRIMVYDLDNDIEECIEEWDVKISTKNKLVVSVDESTYFKKGETITFYRSRTGKKGNSSASTQMSDDR